MRLGNYPCQIQPASLLYALYQSSEIKERHRHRYEFDQQYISVFEAHGMHISGKGNHDLVEAVELKDHPFYIGVQYHPEFASRPNRAHPLFNGFIQAALSKEAKVL